MLFSNFQFIIHSSSSSSTLNTVSPSTRSCSWPCVVNNCWMGGVGLVVRSLCSLARSLGGGCYLLSFVFRPFAILPSKPAAAKADGKHFSIHFFSILTYGKKGRKQLLFFSSVLRSLPFFSSSSSSPKSQRLHGLFVCVFTLVLLLLLFVRSSAFLNFSKHLFNGIEPERLTLWGPFSGFSILSLYSFSRFQKKKLLHSAQQL